MEVSSARFASYFTPGNCSDCSNKSARQAKVEEETENKNQQLPESEKSETEQNSLKDKQPDPTAANPEDRLTEEQLRQVDELKKRDQEVRTHEAAHLAAAGQHALGGPSFDYQNGPDGKRYAVGGEVGIDTSKVANDPEATIAKAQQIRAAAMAPAEPSSQDRRVAAQAAQMEAQARSDLREQQQEETKTKASEDETQQKGSPSSEKQNAASKSYNEIANINPDKPLNIFNFTV
ncbi:MAG: putative metalloprotease CJM1_0395 family protein [Gammaproteobacteria bacterium]|nr:putative metalloprotease CJM1_0395 family protein [Gammaproteobacteria bacterium]